MHVTLWRTALFPLRACGTAAGDIGCGHARRRTVLDTRHRSRRRVRNGSLSPTEIAREFADRIETVNPPAERYVHFDREQVLADAADLQQEVSEGRTRGPLHGVPFSIKA